MSCTEPRQEMSAITAEVEEERPSSAERSTLRNEVVRRKNIFQKAVAIAIEDTPTLAMVLMTCELENERVSQDHEMQTFTGREQIIKIDVSSSNSDVQGTAEVDVSKLMSRILQDCSSRTTFLEAIEVALGKYYMTRQHKLHWIHERCKLNHDKLKLMLDQIKNSFQQVRNFVIYSREKLRQAQSESLRQFSRTNSLSHSDTKVVKAKLAPNIPGLHSISDVRAHRLPISKRLDFIREMQASLFDDRIKLITTKRKLLTTRIQLNGIITKRKIFQHGADDDLAIAAKKSKLDDTELLCEDIVQSLVTKAAELSSSAPSLRAVRASLAEVHGISGLQQSLSTLCPIYAEQIIIRTVIDMCSKAVNAEFNRFDILQHNARMITCMAYNYAVKTAKKRRSENANKSDSKNDGARSNVKEELSSDDEIDSDKNSDESFRQQIDLADVGSNDAVVDNFKDDETKESFSDDHDSRLIPLLLYNELMLHSVSPLRIEDPYTIILSPSKRCLSTVRTFELLGIAMGNKTTRSRPLIRTHTAKKAREDVPQYEDNRVSLLLSKQKENIFELPFRDFTKNQAELIFDNEERAVKQQAATEVYKRLLDYWNAIGLTDGGSFQRNEHENTSKQIKRIRSRTTSTRRQHIAEMEKRQRQHVHFRLTLPPKSGTLKATAISPSKNQIAICSEKALLLYQSATTLSRRENQEVLVAYPPLLISSWFKRNNNTDTLVGLCWNGNTHIIVLTEFDEIFVFQLLPKPEGSDHGDKKTHNQEGDVTKRGLFGRLFGQRKHFPQISEDDYFRSELALILHVPHDESLSFHDSRWMSFASNVTLHKDPIIHPAMTITGYQPNVIATTVFGDIIRFELLGKNYKIVYAGDERIRSNVTLHARDTQQQKQRLVPAWDTNRTLMWSNEMPSFENSTSSRSTTLRRRHSVLSTFVHSSSSSDGDRSAVRSRMVGQTLYRGHNSCIVYATFLDAYSPSHGTDSRLMQLSSTLLTVDDGGCCLIWPSSYDSSNGFGWVEPCERYDIPLVITDLAIDKGGDDGSGSHTEEDREVSSENDQSEHKNIRHTKSNQNIVTEKVEQDELYDYRYSISNKNLWFLSYSWPKTKLKHNKNVNIRQQDCIRHVVEKERDAFDDRKDIARIISCTPDGRVLHKQHILLKQRQDIKCSLTSAVKINNGMELLVVFGLPRGFGLSQFRVVSMAIRNTGVPISLETRSRRRSSNYFQDNNNICSYGMLTGLHRLSIDIGDYSNGAAPPCYAIWKNYLDSAVRSTLEDDSPTETLLFSLGCMRIGIYCLTTGNMIKDLDLSDVVASTGRREDGGSVSKDSIKECYGRHITYMSVSKQKVRINNYNKLGFEDDDSSTTSADGYIQVLMISVDDSDELVAIRLDEFLEDNA